MKKQLLMFVAGILLVACSGNKELETVKQFANDFATKVSNNLVDSIRAMYPDAALCDSFALSFSVDAVDVQETETPGTYKITLGNDVNFMVCHNEDGELNVSDSHGLFAYPTEVMAWAKVMGIWEKDLSDSQLAERLCDNGFKEYLAEKVLSDLKQSIEAKDIEYTWIQDFGYTVLDKIFVVLKNNSDYNLNKEEYSIKGEYWDGSRQSITINTEDIKAHENRRLRILLQEYPDIEKSSVTSGQYKATLNSEVILNITEEDAIKRFYKPTGNEYKEYINNK